MKAVLVISDRDNVATALQPLQPGQVVEVGTATVTVTEAIAAGHKIALRADRHRRAGDQVRQPDRDRVRAHRRR